MAKDKRPVDAIDTYGVVEFLHEMVEEFGPQRAMGLTGWCVCLGAAVPKGGTLFDARDRLVEAGFDRVAVWRAVRDIKRFKHRLEVKRGMAVPMEQVIREISTAGVLQSGNEPATMTAQ